MNSFHSKNMGDLLRLERFVNKVTGKNFSFCITLLCEGELQYSVLEGPSGAEKLLWSARSDDSSHYGAHEGSFGALWSFYKGVLAYHRLLNPGTNSKK